MDLTRAGGLSLESFLDAALVRSLLERGVPVSVTRAPGRLDVMGGIADYSGSLVLQRPIAEATYAAVQRIEGAVLEIISIGRPSLTLSLDEWRRRRAGPSGPAVLAFDNAAGQRFTGDTHWASYVAGPLILLMRERGLTFEGGVRIVVASDVPEGKGVSSSAALETAVMRALVDAFDLPVSSLDQALLCQRAENLIAGAPCGVMDQMACVFGREDALLALLCQPATLQPDVDVPPALSLWGLDSGERHAVGGSDYRAVRTGAFMGLRILSERTPVPGGFLVNVALREVEGGLEASLPDEISGSTFLEQYGGTSDSVTTVDPTRTYKVRVPTLHPIHEHARVRVFRDLLASIDPDAHQRVGELMFESHASYSACGLGSPGTDLLVQLVRREGPAGGLYGARITGGGSGGTVAVIGRRDAEDAIGRVAIAYESATGHRPHIFSGSSSGVASFGAQRITL